MQGISKLFLLFSIYSFLGYIVESIYVSIKQKEFVNRGFLIGPSLPIYGFGAILIISLLGKYKDDLIVLFILSLLLCGTLEYLTSFVLEKVFKIRWWDYSDRKYNFGGRVTLSNLILFGIGGVLIIHFIDPFIKNILFKIPINTINIIAIIIFIIYCFDIVVSVIFTFKITNTTEDIINHTRKDYTSEIKDLVFKALKDNYFTRRIIKTFPNLIIIKDSFKKIKGKIVRRVSKKHKITIL